MKPNTQKEAILRALIAGETLTTLHGVRDFGTVKLNTRLGEHEKKYGFYCEREQVQFKTRFGTHGYYFKYKMKPTDRKKVSAMLKKELRSKK
jgi:hypothetical protein